MNQEYYYQHHSTQNSSLKTLSPFTRSEYDEVISGSWMCMAIFNIQQGTFSFQLRTGLTVKKRKSSFEGGAGMSGTNAGGGCWLCSIRNQEYYYQHRSTQNSKLITQNYTSIHEEWIRRSDLRVLDMHWNTETASLRSQMDRRCCQHATFNKEHSIFN